METKSSRKEKNENEEEILSKDLSRFGHTITALTPEYSVLFGGAIGKSNSYKLSNDTFLYKSGSKTWVRIIPKGELPSKRAAHATAKLTQSDLIIFGGMNEKGKASTNDLFLLEIKTSITDSQWYKIVQDPSKPSPSSRYGHSLNYVENYLVLFGGNFNHKLNNELWICNTNASILKSTLKISFEKVNISGTIPSPRLYHATAVSSYGNTENMIFICGGRGENSASLNDCYGLRRHNNGEWDYIELPNKNDYTISKRFQHSAISYFNFLFLIGGKNENKNFSKTIPIEIYDTEEKEWDKLVNFDVYRTCSWLVNSNGNDFIFFQGGFKLINEIDSKHDIIMVDINTLLASNPNTKKKIEKLNQVKEKALRETEKLKKTSKRTPNISPNKPGKSSLANASNENLRQSSHKLHLNNLLKKENLPMSSLLENNCKNNKNQPLINKVCQISTLHSTNSSDRTQDKLIIENVEISSNSKTYQIKKIQPSTKILPDFFISTLLKPQEWLNNSDLKVDEKFPFSIEEIENLLNLCKNVLENEPSLIQLNTPVKVFGDIHGQFTDLMDFFDKWGYPTDTDRGDILINDYLFLGDYVDRGKFQLETICLLMALKVKYPDRIHLLRGNHEDYLINCGFGFADECEARLNEISDSDDSIFNQINELFEYLPFAAVIDNQILCLHGGIGSNVKNLNDIKKLSRPFEVEHEAKTIEQRIVMDILWSDPTDSDEEKGILPNTQRDTNNIGVIVKYGPDIVNQFLETNKLSYIIRAHECVDDGFERFAGGKLITVFSATDYCGTHKNAGAIIVVNQNKVLIPHLIYPPVGGNNYWINDEEYLRKRPPTPPRIRYNKDNY